MKVKSLSHFFKPAAVSSFLLLCSTAQANLVFPSLELSSEYLGIHLGVEETGGGNFNVGSGSGVAGNDKRTALGRINPLERLPASSPNISNPLSSSKAQEVPNERSSTFSAKFALTYPGVSINFSTTDLYSTEAGIECTGTNCIEGAGLPSNN